MTPPMRIVPGKRIVQPLAAALTLAAALLIPCPPAQASAKSSYLHYLRALLLSSEGSYEEALREYEMTLDLDPESAFVYKEAAELALELGKTERAEELARRFARFAPEDPEAHVLLGHVAWAQGDGAQARERFEKALALKPGFPEALRSLGELLGPDFPEKAKSHLEAYLASGPEDEAAAAAHAQIALIEQKLERPREALGHLQEALQLDPDNLQLHYSLAQTYEALKDTQAALGAYLELLRLDPKNSNLRAHVGELLFMGGEAAAAKEQFLEARAASPGHAAACLWLALLAEREKDFAAAAEYVRESQSFKDEPGLRLRRSYYLTQAGKIDEAVRTLEEAHQRWPDHEEIAYFLALGYDDLGRGDRAIELMLRVSRDRPGHRDAHFQLGVLYEKANRMEEAEAQFREILKSNPNDAAVLNYLGYSLVERSARLEEAEALIRDAVRLDPKNGAYRDSLGWVRFKRGDPAGALGDLKAAARMLPNDETIWDHLGDAHQAVGDAGAAWECWVWSAALGGKGREKKIASAEKTLGEGLAVRFARLLRRSRGRLSSYSGPCQIEGRAGSRRLSMQGVLSFRAPSGLTVEVLGPMFTPLVRLALTGPEGFEMDALELEGVSPEILRAQAYAALSALREDLSGRWLEDAAASHRRVRGADVLSAAGAQWTLDESRVRLKEMRSPSGGRLSLDGFEIREGRWIPTRFLWEGGGLSLEFRMRGPSVRFGDGP